MNKGNQIEGSTHRMPQPAFPEWLHGESGMACRIRQHDWSTTPLGPLEHWPASLRSALTLVLGHPLPMVLGWGADLITIYNDAYRPLLGKKPEALARPFLEVWEEARDIIAPQIAEALAGRTVRFENARFTLMRGDAPAEAWFDYSISSLRDESGQVAGMLNTAFEQTERVLTRQQHAAAELAVREGEKRQAFLLQLSDALRPLSEFEAIAAAACRLLAERFDASRVQYSVVEGGPGEEVGDAVGEHVRRGQGLPRRYPFAVFGEGVLSVMRTGQTLVIRDTDNDSRVAPEQREAFRAVDCRASVTVTLVKGGRITATLAIQDDKPRDWDANDIALVEAFAERTWAEVERARAEAALSASEEKYRTLFESTDEAICVIEVIEANNGKGPDFRYIEANEAHERQTGLGNVAGKLGSEVVPGAEAYWHETYGEIVRTGEPKRVENYSQDTGRWYDIFASRVGGLGSRLVCVISQDTTDRREREERQAYLLKLSDILQRLTQPDDIKSAAMHMLGVHLGASRAQYHEVDDSGQYYDADGIGYADGLPLLDLKYRIDQFGNFVGEDFEAGRPFRSDDLLADPRPTPEERDAYGAYGIRAGAGIPLLRGGKLVAILAVHDRSPHRWADLDMELIRETAERVWVAVERVRAGLALRESEERQAFLLRLSDVIRFLAEPVEVQTNALRLLAEHLGLSRAAYSEIDEDQDRARRVATFDRDLPPVPADVRISAFSAEQLACYLSGRTFVVTDTETDPRIEATREACRAIQVRAWAGVPLVKNGRLLAVLGVEKMTPHDWSDAEIRLVEEAAERTWAASERGRIEAALSESEGRFRGVAEQTEVGVAMADREGRLVWVNDRLAEIVSRTPDELTSLKVRDYTHADDWPENERLYRRMIDEGTAFVIERRIDLKGTAARWSRLSVSPRRDNSGRIVGGIAIIIDITDRKIVEDTLRESEQRFREFGENSSDALWIINAETGQLDYLSPAYERIWGESRTTVMADISRWAELAHPDDRAAASQAMRHLLAGEAFQADYRIIRPDGEVRWIRDAGFPIKVNGIVKRGGGIAQDVTDLRRAEAAVRESETRLRDFGEASQDVLWIRDAETLQWQYLTPAYEFIYGQSRDEALAGNNYRDWLDLIVPEDRAHAMNNIQRVRAGEQVVFDYRIRRPVDGAIRWLRNTDFPIRDDAGNVTLIGGIGHDSTELRESELRLQALIDGIPQFVWRAGDPGLWSWASPQWTAYTGQEQADSYSWGWLEPLHPDDRDSAREAWRQAVERGELQVEYRIRDRDDHYRWFQSRAVPVRDKDGSIVEWLGTSTDIHQLRLLQDRQQVMVQELQHRTRNLITVVNALSKQTLKSAASLSDFEQHFGDRLSALSRVQGLLSHLAAGKRVTFDELLGSELAALGAPEDKVMLDGPRGVPLRSVMVQTFALALHELATNALKHGALAAPNGHLTVRWKVSHSDRDGPRLQVDWRETGVVMTHVGDRPRGGGYGRELIERALPYQLGAKTSYRMAADGVHCTIDVAASRATAGPD